MIKKFAKKIKKAKQGFTLIELIVVVAILAILAAVLIPTIGNQISNAKLSAAKSDANAAYTAAQMYAADQLQAGNPIGDQDLAAPPDNKMLASDPFKSIVGKNGFDSSKFQYSAKNGLITSVKITDSNGSDIVYPVDNSSAVSK